MFEDYKLKVFKAVAACHSFTLASRELNISQPAVSQNIADLEKTAGVQLFVRTRGEVSLTAAGKIFDELTDRIMAAYDDLNAVFSDYPSFDSIVRQAQALKEDPRFEAIKELYLK